MERNNLRGNAHASPVNLARKVRIGFLTLLVTLGSIALALTFVSPHQNARATTAVETNTTTNPWGLVQDGTHIWVAEPGCDLAPKCQTTFAGIIGEYSLTTPGSGEKDFTEPAGYSSPGFLALDGKGNIWFTEPTSDGIGELTPSTTPIWHQFPVTAGSVPRDLTFDKNGNIWFTEAMGNKIGFLSTTTGTVVNNALTTVGSDPYGILTDSNGMIWFGENGNTKLGSFTPTANGTVTIAEVSIGTAHSHMLALDGSGNIWYSEGAVDAVGEFNTTTKVFRDISVASAICPMGSSPTCLQNTFTAGVALDGNGRVWFDDQQTGSIGFINPVPATPTVTVSTTISSPFDGLIVDGRNNVWITEKFNNKLAEISAGIAGSPTPSPSPSQSPSPSPTPTPGSAPVSKIWYFAEGKVGGGFTEFLTIENPDLVNNCAVNIQYLLGSGNPVTKSVNVLKASRFTESVNIDLKTVANGNSFQTDSAVVTVTNPATCAGVVAERPMYFTNFNGVSSGSDVLGATHTETTFYFADVPTGGGYSSFITILNPGNNTATVTATFISGGKQISVLHATVLAGKRGTIIPNSSGSLQHAAVTVTSDQQVVVERPDYFSNVNGGNAHGVTGASSVVGAPLPKKDWLFAEGYTGGGFQEYLALANFGVSDIATNIVLEFSNGHTETIPKTVLHQDQLIFDVNLAIANHLGTCDTNPCKPTPDVSVEVSSTSTFVAQREMLFHYNHSGSIGSLVAMGGSDVIGQAGPASATAYSFAEGYTNAGYNEWLTLQNPTSNSETISVKLVNGDGRTTTQSFIVAAHSRFTVDITTMVVQKLIVAHDTYLGYEVSMVVQSSSGAFVAERPMYWNTGSHGTQGGSDVIGYIGG